LTDRKWKIERRTTDQPPGTALLTSHRRHSLLFLAQASIATASGIIFAKIMNLLMKEKINPLLGATEVSAVPGSAREVHLVGLKEDPGNYLLMHAIACNALGVIGSAICAGVLWSFMIR